MTKDDGQALLADMRRKYLHAREAENGIREGDWRKGEPISVTILGRWIPQVEAMVNVLQDPGPPVARSKSQLRRFDHMGAKQFTCEFCGAVRDVPSALNRTAEGSK